MGSKWVELGIAAVSCALGIAAPAAAQFEDKTCLVFDSQFSGVIRLAALQLDFKEALGWPEEFGFINELKAKQWDLIGIERAHAKIVNKAEILDLFKQQHAGGAKFIVSYAHLDEWPELQEFLGLVSAVDRPFFLPIVPSPPGNPIWYEDETGIEPDFKIWSDSGDYLFPATSSSIVTLFDNGQVAASMTADRTCLVNGWNFDEYGGGTPVGVIGDMIIYLCGCGADVNKRNGILDIDDFLTFQGFFVTGRGPANFDFDDSLTVFDFLEFFNQFVFGCPH